MARNRVIGHKGRLPWGHDMPSDIKRYTDLIRGQTIVMGSNTYGKADHARSESTVVVLSRKSLELPADASLAHTVNDVMALDDGDSEIFVTGGGEVFQLMLEHTNRLFLTIIDENFAGDVLFPAVDEAHWKLTDKQDFKKDDRNKYDYSFLTYEARIDSITPLAD